MASTHPVAHGGTTLHRLALSESTVAEVAYGPGLRVPEHTHAHAHVGFLLSGSCRETVGRRLHDYAPAELVVKSAGETHSNVAGKRGTRFLIVDIDAGADLPELIDGRSQLQEPVFGPIMARLRGELLAPDALSALAGDGLVMELFAEIARARKRRRTRAAPSWLDHARALLQDRALESLSLRGVAAELGLHPTHFARAFRQHTGMTPGRFVRSIRLARAMALLAETDRPLRDVAAATGFADQSHLTRSLRRETGLTPAEYRRRSR